MSAGGVNLNKLPGKYLGWGLPGKWSVRTFTIVGSFFYSGWEKSSYGYHADDGCVFNSSGTGQQFGPQFSTSDVIGCGFNLVDRSIFFTKNGIKLGTCTKKNIKQLHSCVIKALFSFLLKVMLYQMFQ